jgi:hypothetical protein
MNALDLLVDFAALVSKPEASEPGYHDKNVDHKVGTTRIQVDPTSNMRVHHPEEYSPINERRAVDMIQLQSSIAPFYSQQAFSAHAINQAPSHTYPRVPYQRHFAASTESHASQSFDQFLSQHPGLGLPCATSDNMNYDCCDCEKVDHFDSGYENNLLLPEEPLSWAQVQPQNHPPNHLPNYDVRFLETQYLLPVGEPSVLLSHCMDANCHCQYPLPVHQAVGNEYGPTFTTHIWGPRTPVHDDKILVKDEDWQWVSAGGHPETSRT